MSEDPVIHRALASPTRARLLGVLRDHAVPMDATELAVAVTLHHNTVREHLEVLVDARLVRRRIEAPDGPGRPRHTFEPTGRDESYRLLASVFAEHLEAAGDPGPIARTIGQRWGERLAEGLPRVSRTGGDDVGTAAEAGEADEGAEKAVDTVVRLLDELGFAPDTSTSEEGSPVIELRLCPFVAVARERPDVVCNVHLGLVRGVLHQLDAPLEASAIEPFVEPDLLCLVHLRSSGSA